MSEFICPECSHEVSVEDRNCPHCSFDLSMLSGKTDKVPWDDGVELAEISEEERSKDYVEWNEEYNLGIPDIDKQHKGIVALINEIHHTLHTGNHEASYVSEVLDKLDKYIVEHFSYEEKLYKAAKYPALTEHHKQHKEFIKNVREIHEEFASNFVNLRLIMQFLTGWLIEHIGESDRKFAIFWHEKMKDMPTSNK